MKTVIRIAAILLMTALAPAWAAPDHPHTPQAKSIGTVVATENGGSYTYVQLELNGNKVWYAAPAIDLKPGDKVIAPAGLPMKDFHSKTLNRTFDMVYFAETIVRADAPKKAGTHPPNHPPIQSTACPAPAPASFDFSGIEKPQGGKTVAEIHQESGTLAGTAIVVRGKAVKVANSIMGKNWIHLQDGTGKPGANDLTVTTTDTVEVGATVTASGVLATNLDFGFGYKYAVLLQDAAVKAE